MVYLARTLLFAEDNRDEDETRGLLDDADEIEGPRDVKNKTRELIDDDQEAGRLLDDEDELRTLHRFPT